MPLLPIEGDSKSREIPKAFKRPQFLTLLKICQNTLTTIAGINRAKRILFHMYHHMYDSESENSVDSIKSASINIVYSDTVKRMLYKYI